MEKYEILIGKINRRGQGEYLEEYSFNTLEEAGQKFIDVVNYEKENVVFKILKRNEHVEILLQASTYGENNKLLDFDIIDVVSIKRATRKQRKQLLF